MIGPHIDERVNLLLGSFLVDVGLCVVARLVKLVANGVLGCAEAVAKKS